MKSIFIVTYEEQETRGHGYFGVMKQLATYGVDGDNQYPAFKSREDAQEFIDRVSKYVKPEITELPIYKFKNETMDEIDFKDMNEQNEGYAKIGTGYVVHIPEHDMKILARIRNYFGEKDKTQLEHIAYDVLDRVIKHFDERCTK